MWWTHKGSNLGPLPCEGNALPCLAFARPKNRRKTAAYAAYDFVVSYAIEPKMTPGGTRLGPEKASGADPERRLADIPNGQRSRFSAPQSPLGVWCSQKKRFYCGSSRSGAVVFCVSSTTCKINSLMKAI